jgi:hypothetical protein
MNQISREPTQQTTGESSFETYLKAMENTLMKWPSQTKQDLSEPELSKLSDYEVHIYDGVRGCRKLGAAMDAILNGRLYRGQYDTFDNYLMNEWHIEKHSGHWYQLIALLIILHRHG